MSAETAKEKRSDLKRLTFSQCLQHLWKFLKPNHKKLWIGLLFTVVCQVTLALIPSIEGLITSQLQSDLSSGTRIQMDIIVRILCLLGGTYMIKITSQFISAFTLTDSIQKTMFDIRNAVEHKINQLPVSYFDKEKTGDLLSRITNDVETVSNALQQTLSRVVGAVCTLVFTTIMMLNINPLMTLMVYIGLPVIAFISIFVVKKSQPVFDRQQAALANLNSTVTELYTGYTEITVYNHQEKACRDFETVNQDLRHQAFLAQFISGTIGPLTSLISYLVIGVCALYGCLQVLSGALLLGQLQAFIRYIWNINDPISQISQLSSQVQSAFSGMNRLFTFLSLDEETDPRPNPVYEKELRDIQTIDFDHVKFSYNPDPDAPLLMKDLDLHVKQGQRVAIVGPTGAGKTTMINLLLRFYDVNSGSIKINDIDIRTIPCQQLRGLFGMVLQDAWLFEGSIEDNIKYGNETASQSELEAAAAQAEILDLIASQPEGWKTHINESATNISQGEKQLLTIARALIKDPKILILDEATSSVDTRLEKKLQKAMDVLMKYRTSFVIAHRLSTITNADLILVVDHGDIIEQGTHEELLSQNGTYARLYNSQFQDMDEQE